MTTEYVELELTFLSVATVRRTVKVSVPKSNSMEAVAAAARKRAIDAIAADEDTDNAKGTWEVLRLIEPPFLDANPRYRPAGIAPGEIPSPLKLF